MTAEPLGVVRSHHGHAAPHRSAADGRCVCVCVDYGVFFLENHGDNRVRTYQAITVSAITTAAAFASLGVAENPSLHALAWTVAPGNWQACYSAMLVHSGRGTMDGAGP